MCSAAAATAYKRGDLLFHDLERLKQIAARAGPLQAVFAGKAHPHDEGGKEVIRNILRASKLLGSSVKVVYLPDYGLELAGLLTSGVDVWLNTREPPMEASGTSGMKAAINGVPSLSVFDGWWIESYLDGVTGWAIGEGVSAKEGGDQPRRDAAALYDKLERAVLPAFYISSLRQSRHILLCAGMGIMKAWQASINRSRTMELSVTSRPLH